MKYKSILLYSPSSTLDGYGTPQRYQAMASFYHRQGYKVKVLCPRPVPETGFWAKATLVNWIKSIANSESIILSPAAPVWVAVVCAVLRKILVIDYFGPDFAEVYNKSKNEKRLSQFLRYRIARIRLALFLDCADLVLTSSRELSIFLKGILYQQGRLTFKAYEKDENFNAYFAQIPFGFEDTDLNDEEGVCNKYFPNVDFNEAVFIWGGGLWNWFHPEILVRAAELLKNEDFRFKIILPGIRQGSGSGDFNRIELLDETKNLISQLGLGDFFEFSSQWIGHQDFLNILARCRAGISIAKSTFENTLAYRTRIVSYIGAELPTIASGGDPLSRRIEVDQLGIIVRIENERETYSALKRMIEDTPFWNSCKSNIRLVKKDFSWDHLLRQLYDRMERARENRKNKHLLVSLLKLPHYMICRAAQAIVSPFK